MFVVIYFIYSPLWCCSVAHLCLSLCDPMDCMQQAIQPCPSPSPRTCSNSWLLSWWCHPTIHPLSSPSPAFIVCVVTQFSPNQLWCSVVQSTQPTCTRWMTSSCFLSARLLSSPRLTKEIQPGSALNENIMGTKPLCSVIMFKISELCTSVS